MNDHRWNRLNTGYRGDHKKQQQQNKT